MVLVVDFLTYLPSYLLTGGSGLLNINLMMLLVLLIYLLMAVVVLVHLLLTSMLVLDFLTYLPYLLSYLLVVVVYPVLNINN